ncbi:MAG: hypothetical protein GEU95_08945 [Rhizobiales bacterium]|nr:hypothetical protein [Hyphomicrobiales bacterium]
MARDSSTVSATAVAAFFIVAMTPLFGRLGRAFRVAAFLATLDPDRALVLRFIRARAGALALAGAFRGFAILRPPA